MESQEHPGPGDTQGTAEAHPPPSSEPPAPAEETEGIGGQPDVAASAEWVAAPPADPRPSAPESSPPPAPPAPAAPVEAASVNVLEVRALDWDAVRAAVADPPSGERAGRIVAAMEERLAGGGPLGTAFEEYAAGPGDQAIQVGDDWPVGEVWFVGDLHGDLLALEAALQHVDRGGGGSDARLVLLGDLFDDGAHAAEVVLRIFDLMLQGPMRVVVLAGNHDEALSYAEGRFQSSVLPSDFTGWLNEQAQAGHPWAERLGRLIIRFFRRAPRALFFPDGLLVAHAGVPHTDLHPELAETGDWNDPRVLTDFVWLRAHPRARKRIPNRTTRGSEFGREDFAAFCQLATGLGRPVSRMLRGHDHVEERFAVFPAWAAHPALTINTLSHRLPREVRSVRAGAGGGPLGAWRASGGAAPVHSAGAGARGVSRAGGCVHGGGRVKRVIERCPNCGVEHDEAVGGECEVCGTPLRFWCRVHGKDVGWLSTAECPRCVAEEQARRTRAVPPRAPAPARAKEPPRTRRTRPVVFGSPPPPYAGRDPREVLREGADDMRPYVVAGAGFAVLVMRALFAVIRHVIGWGVLGGIAGGVIGYQQGGDAIWSAMFGVMVGGGAGLFFGAIAALRILFGARRREH